MKRLITLMALLLLPCFLLAKEAQPLAEDPVVEARMLEIAKELRCLVCQNESLAGSQADLAKDLRREVRELIQSGKSDQEIRDFLTSRYGDFVLYRPQVKPSTYLLWAGPFIFLILALLLLLRFLRQRNQAEQQQELSEEERHRAAALLKGEE